MADFALATGPLTEDHDSLAPELKARAQRLTKSSPEAVLADQFADIPTVGN